MHDFAVIALLALAVVKLVDFVTENLDMPRMRSLLTFVGALVAVWLLDYSVFAGWDIAVRDEDLAVVMTGFMVAGLTVPWRAVFGYLTHEQATKDETLGEHKSLRAA
jgi:hypothetical protein